MAINKIQFSCNAEDQELAVKRLKYNATQCRNMFRIGVMFQELNIVNRTIDLVKDGLLPIDAIAKAIGDKDASQPPTKPPTKPPSNKPLVNSTLRVEQPEQPIDFSNLFNDSKG